MAEQKKGTWWAIKGDQKKGFASQKDAEAYEAGTLEEKKEVLNKIEGAKSVEI